MKNLVIPKKSTLKNKIARFKELGADSIHVLSDFDRTLTKAYFRNKKTPSIISYLRNGKYLTTDYAKKAHTLYNKYHPIEVSRLSQNYKSSMMLKWWSSHYALLVKSGLDTKIIKTTTTDMIQEKQISLRNGGKEFFNLLRNNNIPLVIMSSAGIGNLVTEFLKQQKLLSSNVHFIGNTLKFDKSGKFKGIKDNKIIHVFNKHEIELRGLPVYSKIAKRRNIILLGDSLGDLGMARGFPYEEIIKVGFYNYSEEESLEDFKKNFDMIILNDSGLNSLNKLIRKLVR